MKTPTPFGLFARYIISENVILLLVNKYQEILVTTKNLKLG
jgi:hypothetical protein